MTQTETLLERFTAAIGQKLQEVSGIPDTYHERSRAAGFPRIIYTMTVWTGGNALRGTLTCTVSGNTRPSEVDHIASILLEELEDFSCCTDDMTYYLHDCRIAPSEDADKSVFLRIFTSEFLVMGG